MTVYTDPITAVFDRSAEARLAFDEEVATIARAKDGDEAATFDLMYAYGPALRAAASRYTGLLDAETARAEVIAGFMEVIHSVPEGAILAGFVKPMLSKALDEAVGNGPGFTVPQRTLQRFHAILREAGGDTTKGAMLAPSYSMTVETFVAVLQAVRSADAIDSGAGEERADAIDRALPVWDVAPDDSEDRVLVEVAFAAVDTVETEVCRIAYGFEDPEPQPDAIVAERVGLSRQKAQRTRAKALGKMREAVGIA